MKIQITKTITKEIECFGKYCKKDSSKHSDRCEFVSGYLYPSCNFFECDLGEKYDKPLRCKQCNDSEKKNIIADTKNIHSMDGWINKKSDIRFLFTKGETKFSGNAWMLGENIFLEKKDAKKFKKVEIILREVG